MSKKGENIYRRKDGRWEARYVKSYRDNGQPRLGYCYAETYREAREKKLACLKTVEPDGRIAGKKVFFSEYCLEWLRLKKIEMKESSFVAYRSTVEKHILPYFGNFRTDRLTERSVLDFSQRLIAERGLSPQRVKDILSVLKMILRYSGRYVPSLRFFDIPFPKQNKKSARVLNKKEEETLTAELHTDTDRCKAGILLALQTGMRIGEVCALRWKDISLRERTLHVAGTVQRIACDREDCPGATKIVFGQPKSKTSDRIIPLTREAVSLLRRLPCESPDAFLLSGSNTEFVEPRTLQYRLEKITEKCGLAGVHFHTLRHTFATRCVECGVEIKSLSEILGHASPRITLEKYVHSSLKLKRRELDKLEKYLY